MTTSPSPTTPSSSSSARDAVLVGNSFPLSLVRRPVRIEPVPVAVVREAVAGRPVASFWGHAVTAGHAGALLGADLTPETERPALTLDAQGHPVLGGRSFRECFVLSPEYVPGYRPAIGEEVPADKITGWQALHLTWD
jgi:hypothetical protein